MGAALASSASGVEAIGVIPVVAQTRGSEASGAHPKASSPVKEGLDAMQPTLLHQAPEVAPGLALLTQAPQIGVDQ